MSDFVDAVKILEAPLKRSLLQHVGSFSSMSDAELEAYRLVFQSMREDIENHIRIKESLQKSNKLSRQDFEKFLAKKQSSNVEV